MGLFGTHIGRGSQNHLCTSHLLCQSRVLGNVRNVSFPLKRLDQTKIESLGPKLREHDVAGLEVGRIDGTILPTITHIKIHPPLEKKLARPCLGMCYSAETSGEDACFG